MVGTVGMGSGVGSVGNEGIGSGVGSDGAVGIGSGVGRVSAVGIGDKGVSPGEVVVHPDARTIRMIAARITHTWRNCEGMASRLASLQIIFFNTLHFPGVVIGVLMGVPILRKLISPEWER